MNASDSISYLKQSTRRSIGIFASSALCSGNIGCSLKTLEEQPRSIRAADRRRATVQQHSVQC